MDDLILPLDAFVRAIGVNRGTQHALFLGAGASITSGIPSAWTCIWEWKRSIFLTNHLGLEDQFAELSLPSVKQRIQRWLDAKGIYPAEGSPEEYSFYVEQCFPISEDRKRFFQEKVRSAKPHVGYQLVCLLAEAEVVGSVWTTNFDGLVPRAAANFNLTPIEVGIDCQERLPRSVQKGELLSVSMHGDYRYDPLKNTIVELQQQEVALREALVKHVQDTPCIVVGYSGRDASVMEALTAAYSTSGPGALYWCGYENDVPSSVRQLIETARKAKRTAVFVPAQGFDDLVSRLASHCLREEPLSRARTIISGTADGLKSQWDPFRLGDLPITGLIKSNAFDIQCPSEVFEFSLKKWPEEHRWRWLKDLTENRWVIAVPFKKKVVAFGIMDDIKDIFGENIDGKIERCPISEDDLRYEDGAVISLLRQALVRSLAETAGLATDGSKRLWEKNHYQTKKYGVDEYYVHRTAIISLRKMGRRMLAVLKPSLTIKMRDGDDAPRDVANQIKLEILGWQHNKEFNQEMNRWRASLLPDKPQTHAEYPPKCGSAFRFSLRQAPLFAGITRKGIRPIELPDNLHPLIKQRGAELPEPNLRFCSHDGMGFVSDPHPIRGLVRNRPFDYSLTRHRFSSEISVGVICPKAEARGLEEYLHKCERRFTPLRTEQDYLLDFPGFASAFGVSLMLPQPGGDGWITCPEINTTLDAQAGASEWARYLTQAVDSLHATSRPNVVVIFVPSRWAKWRHFETENECFDLHDFIKAYCVQKGVATQFIEQDTLADPQQCRVWWWLSLALYAKAMRTPWILDSTDTGTAFVGLGFSLDRKAEPGRHVVLGCSHLYNAQGQGLQYRLSKIEDPVIVRGNPFMSHDDARRVGETIQQLFWESRTSLPQRVVVHKLTPFRKAEREGLQEGLNGVNEVDMVEINVEPALRYVASVPMGGGRFDDDNYPVRRGTLVQLDDYSALLWIHGVTDTVKPGRKYYKGKRRIPAPIVLRRHAGRADLSMIASEILGLSKMDWNSADMYSKLPATVYSSQQIAQIGNLLQRFGPMSYDYRLFI